jgi:2-phospho-L-lactate guanylyltransferase
VQTVASVVGPENVFLVTPEPSAVLSDIPTLTVEGKGLNRDLRQAFELLAAQVEVSQLGVLLPDLPALVAEDIESVISALQGKPVVLCPDREDFGTNAVAMRPAGTLDFLFEGASFSRHSEACQTLGLDYTVLRTEGLAHDCDSVKDLESFCLL